MKNIHTASKICSRDEARRRVSLWQSQGEQVVFSNGCFDIPHLGHVDYLEKARNIGDRLVIGLNTDASVRRLKGEERPINDEVNRARLIASFEFVDAVVLFDEPTPLELITLLEPDVLVKGNDYSIDTIVGAKEVLASGGKVETIELVEGYSTTNIIEKIKKL
ncbi:MAG: D-glycero-beta-D-manno-heptose 1-phosphate adenylyltransferase [Cytophagales bacterium]|nr:D-glycero-beta-D-manno-heptose 1-phosphate adenylyltransferase [Cytophagales bacterium]